MLHTNSVVALFDQHSQAEAAVKQLQEGSFDMKKLSIVGKEYHTNENVVGYYTTGDRMMRWEARAPSGVGSGITVRIGLFHDSRHRPISYGRTNRRLDRRGAGGSGGCRRLSAIGAGLYSIGIPGKASCDTRHR